VARLLAEGKDIVNLGVGEPDFDTPAHIAAAGIEAIRAGITRYTPVDGTAELKDAIAGKFERENGLRYARDQILVSSGAKQTIFNLILAVIDPGDEVVIPAPYWVSYPDMVVLAEGVPITPYAGPADHYKLTPARLRSVLTSRTKLFVLNSPNNPSGAAYTRAELQALGEVLAEFPRVLICTDEIYEHVCWASEPFTSFAAACPELYDRTVTVNGVSKAYAMTGWRIGYCGGPASIVRAMATIQSQSTSSASAIAQRAATVALKADQSCVREMNNAYRRRHNLLVSGLNDIPGLSCLPSAGTFYVFVNVEGAMQRLGLDSDHAFAEKLLEAGVAGVPGSSFGAPGHLRLSFACSLETLEEALRRIRRLVL
jgi:aspartate aminotransferase